MWRHRWRRWWCVTKRSHSLKKAVPRADAAPESVTTLERAANGRRGRFSTTEKRRRECDRGRAQCARVSGSDGATAQVVWRPLVSRRIGVAWRKCTVGQHMGGGSTRDVATRTGAQLSSDWGQHVQARRALRSRFSGSRISRPVGAAWRKCTVMCGVRATGRTGDANQRAASSNSGQVSQSSMVD